MVLRRKMQLIKSNLNLPATVEELNTFILIGKEKLNAHKAKIRAIEKSGMAVMAKEAALVDAQDMADVLLDAEIKMGEILEAVQPEYVGSIEGTHVPKQIKTLPKNVTKKQSHQAQTISKHKEIVEQVKAEAREKGEIPTATQVYRLIKYDEATAKVTAIREKRIAEPDGKYDVIVIDPPWPMEKIERDCRPNQHAFDYPTMDVFCQNIDRIYDGTKTIETNCVCHKSIYEDEELCNSIECLVGNIIENNTADDCHLFLWTTHKFLPMALRLIDLWDSRYVCLFTWHKPGGFQPIGLPQYNSEFVIYARKGVPKFIDTKAFNTCFDAPRGTHSEKPELFYQTITRVTGECSRLDMFSRRKISGFKQWGNEVG